MCQVDQHQQVPFIQEETSDLLGPHTGRHGAMYHFGRSHWQLPQQGQAWLHPPMPYAS